MRVVAILPLYPPHSLVGAWVATHAHLARLAEAGHTVDVVAELAMLAAYQLDGVTVHPCTDNPDELVAAADVVVSHLGDQGHGQILATRHGKPSVRMVHGPVGDHHDRLVRHGYPALVVANSQTSLDWLAWPGRTVVAQPPITPAAHRLHGDPAGHVAAVNMSEEKGGRTVQLLALRCPDVAFRAVRGGYGRQLPPMSPNLTVLPPTPDCAAWLSGASVMLCPSTAETWGMAAVEALAAGVPVIASPVSGLMESLGDAATYVEPHDLNGWVSALRRLRTPDQWRTASARSRQRAAELAEMDGPGVFAAAVEELVA